MNYLSYGCVAFVIPRYEKLEVVEIARDKSDHLENNSFIKIDKRT